MREEGSNEVKGGRVWGREEKGGGTKVLNGLNYLSARFPL